MTVSRPSPALVLAGERRSCSGLLREAAGWAGRVGILAGTPGEARDVAAAHPEAARPLPSPGAIREARVVILTGDDAGRMISLAAGLRLHETDAVVILEGPDLSSRAAEIQRVCGIPPRRLLATGCLPDQLRLEREIAARTGVSRSQVTAPVIGRADGAFLPLRRFIRVAGVPLEVFGGAVEPLPAAGPPVDGADLRVRAAMMLARSALRDRRQVLSCAAFHPAGSGLPEGFYSLPSVVGERGLVSVLGLNLTLEERAFLTRT